MAALYPSGNYAATNSQWYWQQTAATTTIWPPQPFFQPKSLPPSDWERAAVKAEPDDEFSWLRKRVREIEELAFA